MLIIRPSQLATFEKSIDEARARRFADQLATERPGDAGAMERTVLLKQVREGIADASQLEISEDEEVYRFLNLFFLPDEIKRNERIQGVLIRVLNNTALSAKHRLDFIETNISKRDDLQQLLFS